MVWGEGGKSFWTAMFFVEAWISDLNEKAPSFYNWGLSCVIG